MSGSLEFGKNSLDSSTKEIAGPKGGANNRFHPTELTNNKNTNEDGAIDNLTTTTAVGLARKQSQEVLTPLSRDQTLTTDTGDKLEAPGDRLSTIDAKDGPKGIETTRGSRFKDDLATALRLVAEIHEAWLARQSGDQSPEYHGDRLNESVTSEEVERIQVSRTCEAAYRLDLSHTIAVH
jgi:hypothetical protein